MNFGLIWNRKMVIGEGWGDMRIHGQKIVYNNRPPDQSQQRSAIGTGYIIVQCVCTQTQGHSLFLYSHWSKNLTQEEKRSGAGPTA